MNTIKGLAKVLFMVFTVGLLSLNAMATDAPPGQWLEAPKELDDPGETFLFPIAEDQGLMIATQGDNILAALYLNGKVYSKKELERLASWDDMGRLSDELVFKPGEFTWSKLIDFFNNNDSFSVNWSETHHIDNIKVGPNATKVLLPYRDQYAKYTFKN